MAPESETLTPPMWAWAVFIAAILVVLIVAAALPPGCGGPQGPRWTRSEREAVGQHAGNSGFLG